MAANLVEFAQELKQQIAIEQLVADYVPSLRKAGRSFKGLCPFHDEKTPSFTVNPEFGFYHCFGCHARGDAIKFVQEYEKVDFRLAVETLAKRFGIRVPEFKAGWDAEKRDQVEEQRNRLREVCKFAQTFFVNQLWKHPKAGAVRAYLEERGLGANQMEQYEIGFAPPEAEALRHAAEKRGWKAETVVEAGLSIARDRGGFLDRFRNRIIFPIRDLHDHVVAFGGRLIDGDGPKYLNSPDTPLFQKGKLLYGLSSVRDAIRRSESVVILEGYMDWIALHSHGIDNVVAGLGTAFGDEQARLLGRMTREVTLHFDGDEAGAKAMFRASQSLLAQGIAVKVAELPDKHDPDSFVRAEGPEATRRLLEDAAPALDFFLSKGLKTPDASSPEGKTRIFEVLAPLLGAIRSPVLQEAYLKHVAAQLGLEPGTLERDLRSRRRTRMGPGAEGAPQADSPNVWKPDTQQDRLECCLLNHLLAHPDCGSILVEIEADLFQNEVIRSLFSNACTEYGRGSAASGDAPDPFSLCKSEQQNAAMDCILSIESLSAGGELRLRNSDRSAEEILQGCRHLVVRLRRASRRRLRSEAGLNMRRSRAGHEQNRALSDTIHAHSQSVVRQTAYLSGGGEPEHEPNIPTE